MIHNRVSNSDYVAINRYLPPSPEYSHRRHNSKVRDVFYIFISSLIVAGLVIKAGAVINSKVVPVVQAKVAPKVVTQVVDNTKVDIRAQKLQAFLEDKGSPFAGLAQYIVEQSDENGIDWTLIVSIAGKESSYGKNARCYNAWGLGGRDFLCFDSWEESIQYEAKLLSKHYRYNMAKGIQQKYCPDYECSDDWAEFVAASSEAILAVNVKH